MKKVDLRILSLSFFVAAAIFCSRSAEAQNATIQFIHNSPSVSFDTVDLYLNGTKVKDNLLFRRATGLISRTPGSYVLNVNAAASSDSGDQVIGRYTLTLDTGRNNVVVIAGVDTPANYAANPDGRNTSLRLIQKKDAVMGASPGTIALSIYHGSTDAAGLDIATRPASFSVNNLRFGDTTNNFTITSSQNFIDIKDSTGNVILGSYMLPFSTYQGKSLAIFASGFMTPANNGNGPAMAVYAADTAGNTFALTAAARIQFINNSPDVILDSVDIWVYDAVNHDSIVIRRLGFTRASAMMSIEAGTYDIAITKKNSPDTTGTNLVYKVSAVAVQAGKTYLGMTMGVVDTTTYAANPEGLNRSFMLSLYNYMEGAPNNNVNLFYINGVPDAPAFAVDRNPTSSVALFQSTSFRSLPDSARLAVNTAAAPYVLMEKAGSSFIRAYRMTLAGQGAKTGVVFAAGFFDTTGNVTGAKRYAYYLAFTDGTILSLPVLMANLQIIHASADKDNAAVDIYLDGKKLIDNFAFRHATAFMPVPAYRSYQIHVAPANSTSSANGFYNTTLSPDSGKYYYIIATGLKTPSSYASNPNGLNRSFSLVTYADARISADLNNKNVDLLYFHSMTDAPATTIMGSGQLQFLSKNNAYKTFHSGYRAHTSLDEILFEVKDAVEDTLLFAGVGHLALDKGRAGLAFSSGFLHPSKNQNGDSAMLFIAWPDGDVDSIAPAVVNGIREQVIPQQSFVCYPNPAVTQFTITFESLASNRAVNIEVIDITGKAILRQSQKAVKGKNEMTIQTSAMLSGMYFVKLQTGDQSLVKKMTVTDK